MKVLSEYMHRSETAGSYSSSTFNFLRYLHAILHSGFTNSLEKEFTFNEQLLRCSLTPKISYFMLNPRGERFKVSHYARYAVDRRQRRLCHSVVNIQVSHMFFCPKGLRHSSLVSVKCVEEEKLLMGKEVALEAKRDSFSTTPP